MQCSQKHSPTGVQRIQAGAAANRQVLVNAPAEAKARHQQIDAIEAAARKAGLGDDYHLEWVEPEKSAFDELLADFLADAVVALDLGISASVRLPVPWLQGMLEELRFIVEQQGQFTLAAHCLCEI